MKNAAGHDLYYLGCPAWADEKWIGKLFPNKSSNRLACYSSTFNTVEGNTVFYGMPPLERARSWIESAAEGFRFAFKFPKLISHECQLVDAHRDTDQFLQMLALADEAGKLGPSFLQLPPYFSFARFETLAQYLRQLPNQFPFAVEVRHRDFFDNGSRENEFNALLSELKMDRVVFDSRSIHSVTSPEPSEVKAQGIKPSWPARFAATGSKPFVRIVGSNQRQFLEPFLDEWAEQIAAWIQQKLTPYVFIHTADDREAPDFARLLHEKVMKQAPDVGPMKPWATEQVDQIVKQSGQQQQMLF